MVCPLDSLSMIIVKLDSDGLYDSEYSYPKLRLKQLM